MGKPRKVKWKSSDYKVIIWICDKSSCRAVNRREIIKGSYLNDDECDTCHQMIHEPITEEI